MRLVSIAIAALLLLLVLRAWQRRHRVGPGAVGAVSDLLDKDKQLAVQLIVEERTAYADPETRDGTPN
jgi:hypothetical protein